MSDSPEMQADSLDDIFGTSERDAEEGKWFKLGKFAEFKIRRFNSKKSKKVRETIELPYKNTYKFLKMPDELAEEINNRHIAEGLIVDWRGIKDKSGKALPYSKAAAVALLERLPDLKNIVADLSLQLDNFREEVKKDVEGN